MAGPTASLVFGVMRDKDVTAMLRELAPCLPRCYLHDGEFAARGPADELAAAVAQVAPTIRVEAVDLQRRHYSHACALGDRRRRGRIHLLDRTAA